MIWTLVVLLVAFWLLGLIANVGGAIIHALLVIAVIILIVQVVTGRRKV